MQEVTRSNPGPTNSQRWSILLEHNHHNSLVLFNSITVTSVRQQQSCRSTKETIGCTQWKVLHDRRAPGWFMGLGKAGFPSQTALSCQLATVTHMSSSPLHYIFFITETPQHTIVCTSPSESKDKSFHKGNNTLSLPKFASASLPA